MGKISGIDYVDASWGPWRGCTKVSEGCAHCYAERQMKWHGMDFNTVKLAADATFDAPLHWKEPKRIMVCPWGDFFHPDADGWRFEALLIMKMCQDGTLGTATGKYAKHTFVVVTKRPERMVDCLYGSGAKLGYFAHGDSLNNTWLLVTVENQRRADERIPQLLRLRDYGNWPVLGVSIEPMLGEVDITPWLAQLNWVIVGGESGTGARPMHTDWVRKVRDDCQAAHVPFYFKQYHGTRPETKGHLLDGREWREEPCQRN